MIRRKLDFGLTCCFTGHRNIPLSDSEEIKDSLRKAIDDAIKDGVRHFICGGALGFDTLAALEVIKRKADDGIFLEIAVPCRDQSKRWNTAQKKIYDEILENADAVTVLFEKYVSGCMHFRNAFMVDNSDMLIAYYRGRPGGTQYTYMYAESRGLKIINV